MEPKFFEGDVIIVDPEKQHESGKCVIAKNGDEATFKKLLIDGGSVFLVPINERYKPKDMTGIPFKIVGVVVQRITDL
jgi:SOS-response transcriptional repressor LexA